MAISTKNVQEMPVVRDLANFNPRSGSFLERMVFNNRLLFLAFCVVITALFGYITMTKVQINAAFDKVIPQNHPYIKNYFDSRDKLGGLGNTVRVVVERTDGGDIYEADFLETTRKINEALFLTPGVDRAWMRSIWTSSVRWTEVTEEGFRGSTVMPQKYNGSPETIAELKVNVQTAALVGSLVGIDSKSVMFVVPLMDTDPTTGARLDYPTFSAKLEKDIRNQYDSPKAKVHIVGFAKLVGDLIEGVYEVIAYFGVSTLIAAAILFVYTRCIRSTAMVLLCAVIAVVWQLGIVSTLGFELDPYSILVPFLVFAVGVSHGAQRMNGIMQDVARGTHKYVAARYTFRRLFLAGLTAILANVVGFAALSVIDIPVIKDLAITASIGVAVLILTSLLLLPVLLSYIGVSETAAKRSLVEENVVAGGQGFMGKLWALLEDFTERRWAIAAVIGSAALTILGLVVSQNLKVGDLDPGAPELRPDSRYNQDVGYINGHYRLTSDQFVVIVKTPEDGCAKFETLKETERLGWALRQVPGVRSTYALSDNVSGTIAGLAEGNPKWITISRNKLLIGGAVHWTLTDYPEVVDKGCSTIPMIAYLTDHKSETLDGIVKAVEKFAEEHDTPDLKFQMAAGSSGIEAVTNIVVRDSIVKMNLAVYGAVALLCLITFRSWRAVLVAVVPLGITSILCEALMVQLGIGLKVATLPVIALGVGIGVDYSLYLMSVQLAAQRAGMPLRQAYKSALDFTGKVVALVGVTLAAGVVTWAFSPIKFQADMGILLTFMFLWNMFGALVLTPALSYFLLRMPQDKVAESAKPA